MAFRSKLKIANVLICIVLPGLAGATSITIQGTADLWLAGQPNGATLTGNFGTDSNPDNAPVLVGVVGGHIFTFTASGLTSVDANCFAGPDGGCYTDESSFGTGPVNGIGSYKGPSNALFGVFLNSSVPSGTIGPASLDFTDPTVISAASFAPLLNQIFFIGDGLTGTGSGAVQLFTAPAGATRLFLASADSVGASTGNLGSLDVTVSDVNSPEPVSVVLAATALVLLSSRRKRQA